MNAPASAHSEEHYVNRSGWLRAAVLGANDGLLSVASLLVGVSAASFDRAHLLLTGVAAIVAGAMSMAAGEYVSVSSQADSEAADIERERRALEDDPDTERRELAAIYIRRGLPKALAIEVAEALSAHDELEAHARDELGITETAAAKPVQAALASAASFAVGAVLPLAVSALAPAHGLIAWVFGASLAFLAILGAVAARVGGAGVLAGAWRVTFWGALAMAITAGVGALFGAVA
jgi:VIT1/CCC1 family predicted Fe2+/Mn2+ transporter